MTIARLVPASRMSTVMITNPAAVHTSPRTTTDAIAPAVGTRDGRSSSAPGSSTTDAIASIPPIAARGSSGPSRSLMTIGPIAYPTAAIRIAAVPSNSLVRPATSIPTSATTPPKPMSRPSARSRVGRSLWSKRRARTAPIRGTEATTIAASDEDTRCSPKAMAGNGMVTSTIAYRASQRRYRRIGPSTPARQPSSRSTTAPSVIRPQASVNGVIPPRTAMRTNRYGMPQMTEAAANAPQARRLIA